MNSSTLYTGIAVVLAIAVVTVFFFFPNYLGINSSSPEATTDQLTTSQAPADTTQTDPNTLKIQDVQTGTGAAAKTGDLVAVEYVGKLQDGTVFDQSSAHADMILPNCNKAGQFCFTLGQGSVIQGWDQGLVGMKVGGVRKLTIPPNLAYGNQQMGPIPANATLTFEVKLVGINQKASDNSVVVPVGQDAH
jgi:FKBP-type peptidyl-prolyl cis-trans isomerase